MTQKRLKKLLIFGAFLLLLLLILVASLQNGKEEIQDENELVQENTQDKYLFDQSIDVDAVDLVEKQRGSIGTDVNYGIISDYYGENEVYSEGLDLYVRTQRWLWNYI